jgi:hypothetical protein
MAAIDPDDMIACTIVTQFVETVTTTVTEPSPPLPPLPPDADPAVAAALSGALGNTAISYDTQEQNIVESLQSGYYNRTKVVSLEPVVDGQTLVPGRTEIFFDNGSSIKIAALMITVLNDITT